jgi:hypothetical protein
VSCIGHSAWERKLKAEAKNSYLHSGAFHHLVLSVWKPNDVRTFNSIY